MLCSPGLSPIRVVSDLVMRPGARLAAAAVCFAGQVHLLGDQLSELECGSARRVRLEPMMLLNDFNVGVFVGERLGGDLGEFHRQVYCQAHTRRPEDRHIGGGGAEHFLLLFRKAGRRVDKRQVPCAAEAEERLERGGSREVDYHVGRGRFGNRIGQRDAVRSDPGNFAAVGPQKGMTGGFHGGRDFKCGIRRRQGDQTFSHPAGGAVNGNACFFCHDLAFPLLSDYLSRSMIASISLATVTGWLANSVVLTPRLPRTDSKNSLLFP